MHSDAQLHVFGSKAQLEKATGSILWYALGVVAIRRLRVAEWEALRDVRLRALADAPHAFLTTLAEAERRSEPDWRELARRGVSGDHQSTFVAEDAGRLVGMATGYFPDERHRELDDPKVASLIHMWVEPAVRRGGVGRRLVQAVLAWAAERGSPVVRLEVNASDTGAIALYEHVGFRDTGRREGTFPGRDTLAMEMEAPNVVAASVVPS
ncbi:MAG: GNAT family N-acetyltransferase [Chloroflexota bacterium]|nr:GNAT family N-acetyltransferase [Chloroflexota bacterium]